MCVRVCVRARVCHALVHGSTQTKRIFVVLASLILRSSRWRYCQKVLVKPQQLMKTHDEEDKLKLESLIESLENQEDVQEVYINTH